MPISDLPVEPSTSDVPDDVRRFLDEAERRIEEFQRDSRVPGFVASEPIQSYRVLRSVWEAQLAPGPLFCEWGSGFGVIACLAAMVGFDAVGIEIDAGLVEHARRLAADFEIRVEFLQGSFIPPGGAQHITAEFGSGLTWLDTKESRLAFDASDFDVIFAYPWPDEQDVTAVLFERYAKPGALMVSHHFGNKFRVRRKTAKRSRR